uniref:Lipolysis-activating peptide 1-alpha chain n=1 Tax=Buthus israelis TaxID=2899555 RepID=LV1A_BUTIS|nr:RecName: Full=Lipolysis-activating peptide 1-alpha chain; Short=BoiLVP1-alpha; Short=LVP1-alpha; AltName: Full=Putative beta-like toxin Tx458; Short=BoiTx458; AltName: Full=Putative beta-like toxin Tx651; Short=BoiTx651; AltName: Full=Putative beta-like toxin Tx764; Short=BoiTx764; AltName: Full=Putative beta-like toxin Tx814; Short=BoiTx814; Contains: RecName: Full=Neurotoxin BmKBTx-like; AltName: Full=Putative excitatory toxin Tx135; Short=BoiTx135; Flags: Precursor [Buthus occitanus israelis]
MMKLVLFGIIVILFSMIGSIHGSDPPGNYPLNTYGNKYACTILGENDFCQKICKVHGVQYGYCFNSRCWCEYLEEKDVNIWDAVKRHCKNTILYPKGK